MILILLDNSLEKKLDPEVEWLEYKVKCIASIVISVYILQLLLRHSNNLSKALQNSEMSACEGQTLAALSIKTSEKMRNDDYFDSFWDLMKRNAISLDLLESTISRKCKINVKYLGEQ